MSIEHRFTHTPERLRELAQHALDAARRLGASACACEVSEGYGISVTVRKGSVDTIEHHRDKSMGVTVYWGERPQAQRGNASTSDLSPRALTQTVEAAVAIAQHTAVDDCAGLPEPELLAREMPDLDLFHPWHIGTEEAIRIARRTERAAFSLSPKLRNSEGATLSTQHAQFLFANSHGFMHGFPTSRHSLSLAVIAEERGKMQSGDWYSAARVPARVADPAALGRYAGARALARLRARKPATCKAPVLFEAPVAAALIGSFVAAVSGGQLYRKASFLAEALGKPVFSACVTIGERPHLAQALASTPYDEEGVATRDRSVVRAGVLEGYFLGSYSARKLGLRTTANAGGNHNLVVQGNGDDFAAMLRRLHRGLLVTDLMGHGVNLVTGDYSQGASGYWVEDGAIAYPVEEFTVAGNLRDMYRGIAAVGSDVLARGSRQCGSILIEQMTIAGN